MENSADQAVVLMAAAMLLLLLRLVVPGAFANVVARLSSPVLPSQTEGKSAR
jgi:hypothetical protein